MDNVIEVLLADTPSAIWPFYILESGNPPLRIELITGREHMSLIRNNEWNVLVHVIDDRYTGETHKMDGAEIRLGPNHCLQTIKHGKTMITLQHAHLEKELLIFWVGKIWRTIPVDTIIRRRPVALLIQGMS